MSKITATNDYAQLIQLTQFSMTTKGATKRPLHLIARKNAIN